VTISHSGVHPWNPPLNAEFAHRLYAATDQELETLVWQDERRKEQLLFYIRLWRAKTAAFRNAELPSSLSFENLSDVPIEKRGLVWMSDLVLVASEACNMRCAYCSYSSFYPSHRIHSSRLMPWDVARKAIDWFYLYNDGPPFYSYPDRNLQIVSNYVLERMFCASEA
jgi:sulfatase maturation enzyme AslB (radical SAM superfamily)